MTALRKSLLAAEATKGETSTRRVLLDQMRRWQTPDLGIPLWLGLRWRSTGWGGRGRVVRSYWTIIAWRVTKPWEGRRCAIDD